MAISASDILNARSLDGIKSDRAFVKSSPEIYTFLASNMSQVANMLRQRECNIADTIEYAIAMCDRFLDAKIWRKDTTEADVLTTLGTLDLNFAKFGADTHYRSKFVAGLLQACAEKNTWTNRNKFIVAGLLCIVLEDEEAASKNAA